MNRCYIVMSRSAHMPNRCWGIYRRVGVVLVDAEQLVLNQRTQPAMLSKRARGVVKLHSVEERLHYGSGSSKTAAGKALAESRVNAATLNAELDGAASALELLNLMHRALMARSGMRPDRADEIASRIYENTKEEGK